MYNVGDLLICKDNSLFPSVLVIGRAYTVKEVFDKRNTIKVEDKHGTVATINPKYFVPYMYTPYIPYNVFKQGDHVRCISPFDSLLKASQTYVVRSVSDKFIYLSCSPDTGWYADRFELDYRPLPDQDPLVPEKPELTTKKYMVVNEVFPNRVMEYFTSQKDAIEYAKGLDKTTLICEIKVTHQVKPRVVRDAIVINLKD